MVLVFYGPMQPAEAAGPQAAAWFVEPDRVDVRPRARRVLWAPRDDDGVTSMRAVIASSVFLALLAVGLLVGGHAAVDPLLQLAIAARDPTATGDVVYTMPDGRYCRHMTFDNATAEMIEGTVERCPDNIAGAQSRSLRNFSWGGR